MAGYHIIHLRCDIAGHIVICMYVLMYTAGSCGQRRWSLPERDGFSYLPNSIKVDGSMSFLRVVMTTRSLVTLILLVHIILRYQKYSANLSHIYVS